MKFDAVRALRKATGRAKSDVANKLVSMFFHEISKRACVAGGMAVSSEEYANLVTDAFGNHCLYCRVELERDRAAIEHLDGMNRFRLGLHVPGNVAVACRRCNCEKRRDDQLDSLDLAPTGWASFLSHDGSRCPPACKTCSYWASVFSDETIRRTTLAASTERIQRFRERFLRFSEWSERARPAIRERIDGLYRDCQDFATREIDSLTSQLNFDFSTLRIPEHRFPLITPKKNPSTG